MRFSLTSLVRLIGLLSLAVCAVAIGVARAVPDVPVFRTPAAPRYHGLNGAAFTPPVPGCYLLNTETGSLSEPIIEDEERIDYLTCSPWTIDSGRHEFIGRSVRRTSASRDAVCVGMDLIRVSGDGSRTNVGRLDLNPSVCGRPCWIPGRPDIALFAGGDGKLYRQSLSKAAGSADPEPGVEETSNVYGGTKTRREFRWACNTPGELAPLISDPICPPIPALKGKLIVTLSLAQRVGNRVRYFAPRLWWMEIDADTTSINRAGPLIVDAVGEADSGAGIGNGIRLANLALRADGRVIVAFLGRDEGIGSNRLFIGEVILEPDSGRPWVDPGSLRVVARDVAATTPPISPGGRWIYLIKRETSDNHPEVRRIAVDEFLGHSGASGPTRTAAAHGGNRDPDG